jgi:amidohydrolase
MHGAEAELEVVRLTPAVVNDPQVTERIRKAAEGILGAGAVSSEQRTMGSEDAAFFMEHIPGCYFFLGGSNPEKGLGAPHHNPHFNFDEEVLVLGVAILAHAAAGYTQHT